MITRRSRIAVRWTTDPEVLGYGIPSRVHAARSAIVEAKPDFIGSPRTALEYVADIRRKVGHGVMYFVLFTSCATGQDVDSDDLRAVIA